MTLRQKQSLFAKLAAGLILHAYKLGYEVTLGEAYRPKEMADLHAQQGKGISNSLHTQRLAIDLNLFKDGVYLTTSEAHKPLGDWWKKQHELCCWGGDFRPKRDGNHYSLTHGGRKKARVRR